jgi:hypothetical protein
MAAPAAIGATSSQGTLLTIRNPRGVGGLERHEFVRGQLGEGPVQQCLHRVIVQRDARRFVSHRMSLRLN